LIRGRILSRPDNRLAPFREVERRHGDFAISLPRLQRGGVARRRRRATCRRRGICPRIDGRDLDDALNAFAYRTRRARRCPRPRRYRRRLGGGLSAIGAGGVNEPIAGGRRNSCANESTASVRGEDEPRMLLTDFLRQRRATRHACSAANTECAGALHRQTSGRQAGAGPASPALVQIDGLPSAGRLKASRPSGIRTWILKGGVQAHHALQGGFCTEGILRAR